MCCTFCPYALTPYVPSRDGAVEVATKSIKELGGICVACCELCVLCGVIMGACVMRNLNCVIREVFRTLRVISVWCVFYVGCVVYDPSML